MTRLGICGAACCAALVLAHPGFAFAGAAVPLSDSQLDNVTAGSYAVGSGSAAAQGLIVNSTSNVVTTLGPDMEDASATGQVSSSATSSNAAPAASASSTLSLRIIVP